MDAVYHLSFLSIKGTRSWQRLYVGHEEAHGSRTYYQVLYDMPEA
jgi:hypothetical protein